MFHLILYYFMLHHMHIHTSILFTLHHLLSCLHLHTAFHYSNIVPSSLSLLMSNNILHFHSIMTSHHLLSILYLYRNLSINYLQDSFIHLVPSYLIYRFNNLFMCYLHYLLHIHVIFLFNQYYQLQYLNWYIQFNLSYTDYMLYLYLLSNNILQYLFKLTYLLLTMLLLYLPFSILMNYYYSHSPLVLQYPNRNFLYYSTFMDFTKHLLL